MKYNWGMKSLGVIVILFLNSLLGSAAMAADITQLGWPASLADVYHRLDSKPKNYVILVSRVPSIPVDFRTENGMRNSINSFSFQNNFHPGHEMIGWKCTIGGSRFESMLGYSGESDDQHLRLLNDGWGLSALLATFKDGFIQTPDILETRFKYYNEENAKSLADGSGKKISLISTVIEVSEDDCSNMINEVYEYVNHPKNPIENFSMILSPANYEGAGCGSFVTHFMEQISTFKTLIPLFRRQFNLPNYLFGSGPFLPDDVVIPEKITRIALKKPVSKLKLISSTWSSSVSPNVSVEITDPELIVFWQKLFFEAYFDQNHLKKDKKSFAKSMTRGIWARDEDNLYGDGQSQSHFVTIDKNYDQKTSEIVAQHSHLLENAELTYFTFSNFPGIILEKK